MGHGVEIYIHNLWSAGAKFCKTMIPILNEVYKLGWELVCGPKGLAMLSSEGNLK